MTPKSLYGEPKEQEFVEEVLNINRVSKVVKGGRRFGFTALCAVGNQKNRVGLGFGRGSEVVDAIQKGFKKARKNMIDVVKNEEGYTVPYKQEHEYCSTKIIVKPTRPGTGVIAGGPARTIFTLAGIRDVTCKYHGSNNSVNCAKAAFEVLKRYEDPQEILRKRHEEAVVTTVEEVIEERVNKFANKAEQKRQEMAEKAAESEGETEAAPTVSEEDFRRREREEAPATEEMQDGESEAAGKETGEAQQEGTEDILEGEADVATAQATKEEVAETELEEELEEDSGEPAAEAEEDDSTEPEEPEVEAADAAEAEGEDVEEDTDSDPPGLTAAGSAESEDAEAAAQEDSEDTEEDTDEEDEAEEDEEAEK